MRCIFLVTYTVGINEDISDCFSPSMGLRQGDLLSPYLFLICAEGLSILMNEATNTNLLRGAQIRKERLTINHLLFADDCILFGDALEERACIVRNIIREYELVSG
ncbi:hypothetical protein J1N35_027476 [Gossypium stocksii]|uniref:Reverse transcriptase domain-containing protein n=1 Tax=Gossypium stocksii TaxID=47602 RepID=A0A9D3VCJ1_9ROSI|nr:hypothetical protein J1N35_027476 [Gossypium stocksii]